MLPQLCFFSLGIAIFGQIPFTLSPQQYRLALRTLTQSFFLLFTNRTLPLNLDTFKRRYDI